MIKRVYNFIMENNMINRGDGIIVGVSGGADSICLLNVLHELKGKLGIKLYAVHINHGIRGEEADGDEKYVEEICRQMNVWYRPYRFDIPAIAKENGLSEEEMGRNIRYKTFREVKKETGAAKIAVAHNSDDSVETILYNICRGTGIRGACGIPPVRDDIIRPVLCCSRKEIEGYLKGKNIIFRTDSTNLKNSYTRNKIRLELIPYLKDNINDKSREHILSFARQLGDISDYINRQAQKAYSESVEESEAGVMINIGLLKEYADIIRQETVRMCIMKMAGKLKDITETHVGSVMALMENESGKSINLPYNIVCENVYGYCRIRIGNVSVSKEESRKVEVSVPGEYELENGSKFIFTLENSVNFKEKMYTKWFDYDKIRNVMQIRFRKNGDFLEVAGGGHKKLKSYFIDEKIPREQRDKIPLLCDGSHVIWITGYRISEAYKITDSTKNVLKVQYIERNGNDNG